MYDSPTGLALISTCLSPRPPFLEGGVHLFVSLAYRLARSSHRPRQELAVPLTPLNPISITEVGAMLNEVCSKGLLDYKIVYIYLPENEQALPQLKSTYLWLSHIIQSCQV